MSRLRTVFFGTPDFAVPTLRRLADDDRFTVDLVVTQPDRPTGRGQRVTETPVKRTALQRGLPIYQPTSLRTAEARESLVETRADIFIVTAYGLIFGRATLALPRLGCLNLHASLLPKYRGASPVSAAILAGERETGVSLMLMDPGLDTGPIIDCSKLLVREDDSTGSLTQRLATLAADLAIDAIPAFADGTLQPIPQPETGASLTRPLTKADGWVDWADSAEVLDRHIRAMAPWPKAWTTIGTQTLQIHSARVVGAESTAKPGQVLLSKKEIVVACGDGALVLDSIQPAGGKAMSGGAFLSGRGLEPDAVLGADGAPPRQPPLIVPIAMG
ncbi:MAG: methionyl-tRNA formyltransferase [Thermomicrobiales bacterium]